MVTPDKIFPEIDGSRSWFDDISSHTGVPRDPVTEARARELGLYLRERVFLLEEDEWSRVLGEVEGMGKIECVIVWTVATGGLLTMDDGLDRAKILHKRLSCLVLAALTVPHKVRT